MIKNNWNQSKGWGAAIFSFLTCPCHLPITIPLAISLTAATITGAWIANNKLLIAGVFTVLFLGGVGLSYHWFSKEKTAPKLKRGPKDVVVVTSSACDSCEETVALWNSLKQEHGFKLRVVGLKTKAGRQLVGEKNIFTIPVTIINDQIAFRGTPRRKQAAAAVKR